MVTPTPASDWLLPHFCATISPTSLAGRQVTIVDRRVCSWVDIFLSLLGMCKVFSHAMNTLVSRTEGLGRHQLDFSVFSELCKGGLIMSW